VRVVRGRENLTAPTTIETRVAHDRNLSPDERLACQAVVLGNCEVATTYW